MSLMASLAIMRRMPPQQTDRSLAGLTRLIEDDETIDQVYQRVDRPLEVMNCEQTGDQFLLCEFNRDGDSYRSPWSNEFQPPNPSGTKPSNIIRNLEIKSNEVFKEYVKLYYSQAISSVYLWETNQGFAGSYITKKDMDQGQWESTSLMEIVRHGAINTYNLTSTVFIKINTGQDFEIAGSLSRNKSFRVNTNKDLFCEEQAYQIVVFIEELECSIRNEIDGIYIGKTKEILDRTRKFDSFSRGRALPGLSSQTNQHQGFIQNQLKWYIK